MMIGERIKTLRESKNLSQGDIQKRTGLLRCYVSRVENGHTIPAIETLEKFARALEVPMYQLVYDGAEPPKPFIKVKPAPREKIWGDGRAEATQLQKLVGYLSKMQESDRQLVMSLAQQAARRAGSHKTEKT